MGCREAPRLTATGKALKTHEAYGRMWLEIQPRGCVGIKPLRGCETLGAEGVGEANQRVNDRHI